MKSLTFQKDELRLMALIVAQESVLLLFHGFSNPQNLGLDCFEANVEDD